MKIKVYQIYLPPCRSQNLINLQLSCLLLGGGGGREKGGDGVGIAV